MIFLIGLIAVAAGIICIPCGLATYGKSGPWFGIFTVLFVVLMIGGAILAIFGAGVYFSHPHTIHIG